MQPIDIKKTYYIKGVLFDISIEDYVAIRKHQSDFGGVEEHVSQTLALKVPQFTTPEDKIRHLWETTEPMSPQYAFEKFSSNSQQLMTVLSIMGAEHTLKLLKSEIIDRETITKTQMRTFIKDEISLNFENRKHQKEQTLPSDLFETREVQFNDTYTLYKINKEQFNKQRQLLEEDVVVLEVKCPSTQNNYYIFVDPNQEQCKTAIGAVAWTMVKENGDCLSREEYMNLQKES